MALFSIFCEKDQTKWQLWFAWYPIIVELESPDRILTSNKEQGIFTIPVYKWMEYVQRRKVYRTGVGDLALYSPWYWEYRELPEE